MTLTFDQIKNLLSFVAVTTDDTLDCDDCFSHVAQFAETKLSGLGVSESMKLVQTHLENCPCCKDEFQALLAAMAEVDE